MVPGVQLFPRDNYIAASPSYFELYGTTLSGSPEKPLSDRAKLHAERAQSRLVVDYDRCTIGELRSFIARRTGKSVRDGERKEQLVETLLELDEKMTFPLMDLPVELRNEVYRHLLVGLHKHPAILKASKKVYGEAKKILYDEMMMHVSVTAEARCGNGYMRGQTTTFLHVEGRYRSWAHSDETYPGNVEVHQHPWKEAVSKARNVTLYIGFKISPWSPWINRHHLHFDMVESYVWHLGRVINAGPSFKNITVIVNDDVDVWPRRMMQILEPLAVRPNIKLYGVREEVEKHFRKTYGGEV